MREQEKRQAPRIDRRERAFIQLLMDGGRQQAIATDDVSRGGFRATLTEPVAEGSLLHLVIALESAASQRFLLAAEVRWCRALGADQYQAGFALLDARDTDYDAWRHFTDALMPADPDA